MKKMYKMFLSSLLLIACITSVKGQDAPELSAWIIADGSEATYYEEGNTTIQDLGGLVNVKFVKYDDDFVYVNSSGLPAYTVGPYPDGNRALPGDIDYLYQIPRNPVENTGTKTATSLGHIGVYINGVPMYNSADALSYNNLGIWNRDAILNEADGFDCNRGHPSPNMSSINESYYHHHQVPISFSAATNPDSDVCDTYPTEGLLAPTGDHSPIIGYSFDGYPVYGPYGFSDSLDASSSVRIILSSYQERIFPSNERTTLPDGTVLSTSEYGPDVNDEYPVGTYAEDYEYIVASGDLDEYNGRFCVTPEYPNGTYAYFSTVDADLNSTYPYGIGPTYYGVVETKNTSSSNSTSVTVPNDALTFDEFVIVSTGSGDFSDILPDSAEVGSTAVTVNVTIDDGLSPAPPPNDATPDDFTIGGISGSNLVRDENSGEISATFDLSTLAIGDYDILVSFTTPQNEVIEYTSTDGFEIIDMITGLSTSELEQLTLFPSPATGIVTFSQEVTSVSVRNVLGNIVYTSGVSSQIDVTNWKSGMYFVSVEGKIIKLQVK